MNIRFLFLAAAICAHWLETAYGQPSRSDAAPPPRQPAQSDAGTMGAVKAPLDYHPNGNIKTLLIAEKAKMRGDDVDGINVRIEFYDEHAKPDGLATLDRCAYDSAKQSLTCRSKVEMRRGGLNIQGVGMDCKLDARTLKLARDVKVTVTGSGGAALQGLFGPADPADPRAGGEDRGNRSEITARSLVYDWGNDTALFEQNVALTNAQNTLRSDLLSIGFGPTNEIESMAASGHVEIVEPDKTARCEKAVYRRSEGKAVLWGNPAISMGDQTLTGEKIVVWTAARSLLSSPGCLVVSRAGKDAGRAGRRDKLTARSRLLTYDSGREVACFEGDVVMKDPQLDMTADRAWLFLDGTNDVKRAVARGSVVLSRQDQTGSCREAEFVKSEDTVYLRGDANLAWGLDTLRGEEIRCRLDKDTAECENGRLLLHPRKKQAPAGNAGTQLR